jgi:hypothetical protein
MMDIRPPSSPKYTIGEKEVDGVKTPYIIWGEEHDQTADDLINQERDTTGRKQKKQIDEALEWLPLTLARGQQGNCSERRQS